MKNKKFLKLHKISITAFAIVSTLIFAPSVAAKADTVNGGTGIAGISYTLNEYYSEDPTVISDSESVLIGNYEIPENIAIARVNNQLNVRSGPSTSYSRVGLLNNGACCIIESVEGEWAKVKSGTIEGYAFLEYLITGDDAVEYIKTHYTPCVVVNSSVTNLNIRAEASTESTIVSKAKGGTSVHVLNDCIVNKEEDENKLWSLVEYEKGKTGYVSNEYVSFSFEFVWAEKYTPYGPGVSDLRCNICDYGKKFIGTKYVWGGNDLYKGIDCSGFVKKVFANFGYTLPRVSRDIAAKYKHISKSELKPGDLVFYGTKDGYINHVSIYIGNEKIIHSSTNCNGINISSMYFYNIICYARVIND